MYGGSGGSVGMGRIGRGGESVIILLMRQERVSQVVQLKNDKEYEGYKRREQRNIEGVPHITLGKAEGGSLQVFMDELKPAPIIKLKELNGNERAFAYAKTVIQACCALATHYGLFMVNENMIFFNALREIYVWINPQLIENHIKIYLPRSADGEASMVRSIVSYLKLWLKCDFAPLSECKKLNELRERFLEVRAKMAQTFRARSPDRQFVSGRRLSGQFQSGQMRSRYAPGANTLMENRSNNGEMARSPQGRQMGLTGTSRGEEAAFKNRTTQNSEKEEFEHRSFNNKPNIISANKSVGIKSGSSLYPNKTTSNKNHIVSLINKLDDNPSGYVKNKILLDDEKMDEMEKAKLRKMKESLDGIGEEVNDLFSSNIENEEESPEDVKKIQDEIGSLLD